MATDTSEVGTEIGTFTGTSTTFTAPAPGYYLVRITATGAGTATIESDNYTCPYSSPYTDRTSFYLGCSAATAAQATTTTTTVEEEEEDDKLALKIGVPIAGGILVIIVIVLVVIKVKGVAGSAAVGSTTMASV